MFSGHRAFPDNNNSNMDLGKVLLLSYADDELE